MIAIRSRGAATRRIAEVEKTTQLTTETLNYLLPTGLLLAFGAHRLWRRRATAPAIPTGSKEHAA